MYRPSQARVLLDGSETRNKKLTAVSQHLLGKHNQLKAVPATTASTSLATAAAATATLMGEATTASAAVPMLVAAATSGTASAAGVSPLSAAEVAAAEEVGGHCLASSSATVASAPGLAPTTTAAAAALAPLLSADPAAAGSNLLAPGVTAGSNLLAPGETACTGQESGATDDLCLLCTSAADGDGGDVDGTPTTARDDGETRAGFVIGVPEEADSGAGATSLGGGVASL